MKIQEALAHIKNMYPNVHNEVDRLELLQNYGAPEKIEKMAK